MDSGYNLIRLFGIQFRIHFSWFFIFLLVTVFLSWQVFPITVPGKGLVTYWLMGGVTALLFFISILLHETAHSLVGRANGIPVRSITLYLFGGAAQMDREPEFPGAELKMALAGPVTSLLLAGICWIIYSFYLNIFVSWAAVALWLAQINLIVALFNLLPGFPLDGGRVLRGIWWNLGRDYKKATRGAIFYGRVIGFFIIASGGYFIIAQGDWMAGVWLLILGWYLESTARKSLSQFELQIWLKGREVSEVIRHNCPRVSVATSLTEILNRYPGHKCFLVGDEKDKLLIAWVEKSTAVHSEIKIGDMAREIDMYAQVYINDNLLLAVQKMNESGLDFTAVRSLKDEFIGIVLLDDLIDLVNN